MDDKTSKNIIIALLIIFIVGLIVVIYTMLTPDDTNVDTTYTADEVEDMNSEKVSNTQSSISSKPKQPIEEDTALLVPVVNTLPQVNVSEIDIQPGMEVVTYTDSGFFPPIVEITAGNSVVFVNSSNKPMWITSENHPTAKAQVYPGFTQGKSVSTGGTYTFSFTTVGVWGYKNLNNEKHLGAVSVIPQ